MADRTKDAVCTICGKSIKIHIFASAKTAKCDDCKKGKGKGKPVEKKGQWSSGFDENRKYGPRIDGEPNPALARLCCPIHSDKPMKVIGVIKGELWGDIITYQCRVPKCWLVVQISEQSRHAGPLRTRIHGDGLEGDMEALTDEILECIKKGELAEWWQKQLDKYQKEGI